jgi:DNA adenine methylase
MKTLLRYAGGKSKAYKHITKYLPFQVNRIISPFIGGGSLEVQWSSLGIDVIGYDIFWHLTNFWHQLLNNKEELIHELSLLEPNKEYYKEIKELLLCWDKTQKLFKNYKTDHYKRKSINLTAVKGAAYYYYNFQLSYGPMFLGWFSSNYNQRKYDKILERMNKFNVPFLDVFNDTFENVIPNHQNDVLYLDPPYFLGKDKDNKMFKGIYPNANFDIHHTGFNHKLLRNLLYNHKSSFILSYNNCSTIREWYKDFELYYPEWNYSFSNGETRIGKNKVNNTPKRSHEILIIKR